MTRDLPFPVASGVADLLPSGSPSARDSVEPAAPVRFPAELSSPLQDAAPATAAALALRSPLDCWAAIYAPAHVDERGSLADTTAGSEEAPAEASEGRALALWSEGRVDEAIEILERQIALQKDGPPALPPTAAAALRVSESTAVAMTPPRAPRRFVRPAALFALCAGAALLAGIALWNGRDAGSGDAVAQPPLEIAADPVETALQTPAGPPATPLEEPLPTAEVMQAPRLPEGSGIPQVTAEATEPAPADMPQPETSVAAEPTTTEPTTAARSPSAAAPAVALEPAVVPADARVPKRRPDAPAAQTTAVRNPAGAPPPPRAEPGPRRLAPPPPAPRQAAPRPPRAIASSALRSRLAERRAAAQNYAARRRAAAERRRPAPQSPSILLGGRGLP